LGMKVNMFIPLQASLFTFASNGKADCCAYIMLTRRFDISDAINAATSVLSN